MGFWKNVRNKLFSDEKRESKGQGYDFSKWFSPKNIFTRRNSHALATSETVFAAVSRLSNSMATLPIKLYKDFNPVFTSVSDLLMNSPNPNMTAFEFIRTLETQRDTAGNSYAIKMYSRDYQIESLHILDPNQVTPVIEEDSHELWYEVNAPKGRYFVHNMDIIHLKHIYSDGYKGISPIDVLQNTIEFDDEVRKFSLTQMDEAKFSFILKYTTNLSREKKDEIIENFRSFYADNGGVLIQEAGFEIDKLESKFIDTKAFEAERVTRSRVANVFNMPIHMLGETEGSSYASMEQLSLDFVTFTLMPIIRQYEQEFNRKLLTPSERSQGLYFKFNVNALLRGDMNTRGEFYFKGIRSGWFKPNEVRAWEELPPVAGGDQVFVSGDLYPIEQAGKEVKMKNEQIKTET